MGIEDDAHEQSEDGMALCLSGGGYRAMVFHLGALMRLNDALVLKRLSRVSSVSGGSITAAYLALKWDELDFDQHGKARNLAVVVDGIRRMAGNSVDVGAVLGGIFLPGTIADRVAEAYDDVLFNGASLANLPGDGAPRFVINATNVQSGALWRFSRPYMGDYRVGLIRSPRVALASAVAASSAFPPVLSPYRLDIEDDFDAATKGDLYGPEYEKSVLLTDGGVYDNLGLETAYKRYSTLLVSDGGQKMTAEAEPAEDWARHSIRVLSIVDNQVRSLRKRQLIEAFDSKQKTGAYWGIATKPANYKLKADPLGCLTRDASGLAATPTRLQAMPADTQEKLINWGYAVADLGLRAHVGQDVVDRFKLDIGLPSRFPYARAY